MDHQRVQAARHELFNLLKPCCVRLSQLALRSNGVSHHADLTDEIRKTLQELFVILNQNCHQSQRNDVFDTKLADYVFFPLSCIFRSSQSRPSRQSELAVKCLKILLEFGWKRDIAVDLAKQLLILLTLFAGGSPTVPHPSEELKLEAHGAIALLFQALKDSPRNRDTLESIEVMPLLSQCLSVLLDDIVEGPSQETQIEALKALRSFWECIKDQQAHASFLPGVVSALTKSLIPTTKTPRSTKVLVSGINVYGIVISRTIGDLYTRNINEQQNEVKNSLTLAWLRATTDQVKLSITNIVRLREHKQNRVRESLAVLCLLLLDECYESLANARFLLVETCMMLTDQQVDADVLSMTTSLADLAMLHTPVRDAMQSIFHKWIVALPRIILSNDEIAKSRALRCLANAHRLFPSQQSKSSILVDALRDSLRDAISNSLEITTQSGIWEPPPQLTKNLSLLSESHIRPSLTFRKLIMPQKSQAETGDQLHALIESVGSPDIKLQIATDMVGFMQGAIGNDLISSFWLTFRLLQSSNSSESGLDSWFSSSLLRKPQSEILMAELFAYSISTLSELEPVDWRVHAIGLEVVAYSAQLHGIAFREELVDVLLPVVRILSCDNKALAQHAMVCLNLIAESSGYQDTRELIISNSDYLVNAIALKLDTFEISPDIPQILRMMIQVAGPSLLPFLDDVIVSIFAALRNYHGYSSLVESLFLVLADIVDESQHSGLLMLTTESHEMHRKSRAPSDTMEDLIALLVRRKNRVALSENVIHDNEVHNENETSTEIPKETQGNSSGEDGPLNQNLSTEISSPTKIYAMVQSITSLAQHHLTNQSSALRQSLLNLVCNACPVLQSNENHFLPLVNDIWPILFTRVFDEEVFVSLAAMKAVGQICHYAGDFVSTRIKTDWHKLSSFGHSTKEKARHDMGGLHSRSIHSVKVQLWEGMIELAVTIVENVRVDDEIFDDVLGLLAAVLDRQSVRDALAAVDEDALWLWQVRNGRPFDLPPPILDGYRFANMTEQGT